MQNHKIIDNFSKIEEVHEHSCSPTDQDTYNKAMKKLKLAAFVSVFFIAFQLVGGYVANSIAIFTDTAHLASDLLGFAMSMGALKVSLRPASKEHTYGWHRAEIIGTLISVSFLVCATLWLVFEATGRIINPQQINAKVMVITAISGLIFNLI